MFAVFLLLSSLIMVKDPDELFTKHDREPYIIEAETVTLDETDEGRVSHLFGNVTITHGKTVITGSEGYVYEEKKIAEIIDDVKIDDEGTIITAGIGRYFRDERMAVLVGNVELTEGKQILKADSLAYYKESKLSKASGNVLLIDQEQHTEVSGEYGEYDFVNEEGFMTKEPLLTLTEEEKKVIIEGDTLRIKRKEHFMSCNGNVRVREDSIVARAGFLEYYSDSERIHLREEPIVEQEGRSTLTGFTIEVFLKKREIVKTVATIGAQGIYSFSDGASNDVRGDSITIHFVDGKTDRIVVVGNAHGVYKQIKEEEEKQGEGTIGGEEGIEEPEVPEGEGEEPEEPEGEGEEPEMPEGEHE
jgi:lipopolysaccharide export system protein LptA